jgi:hypothetical protein
VFIGFSLTSLDALNAPHPLVSISENKVRNHWRPRFVALRMFTVFNVTAMNAAPTWASKLETGTYGLSTLPGSVSASKTRALFILHDPY